MHPSSKHLSTNLTQRPSQAVVKGLAACLAKAVCGGQGLVGLAPGVGQSAAKVCHSWPGLIS